ncbi:hypothetical protein [Angustibacter luteus]|uniref:Uncharacterized protein n=1 Tax=Angustibacter luteus TaxID=658456 RepID=A0ABW1JIK3_9ACTN
MPDIDWDRVHATSRTAATPTSFGWRGRLALTAPPFVWLLAFGRQFVGGGLPSANNAFAFLFGGAVLLGGLCWATQVWAPSRVLVPPSEPGGPPAPPDLALEPLRRPPHATLGYLQDTPGDGPEPSGPVRW